LLHFNITPLSKSVRASPTQATAQFQAIILTLKSIKTHFKSSLNPTTMAYQDEGMHATDGNETNSALNDNSRGQYRVTITYK